MVAPTIIGDDNHSSIRVFGFTPSLRHAYNLISAFEKAQSEEAVFSANIYEIRGTRR